MRNRETGAETLYETFAKRQAGTIVAANDASQPRKHSGTERHNDDRPTSARCSVTMVIIAQRSYHTSVRSRTSVTPPTCATLFPRHNEFISWQHRPLVWLCQSQGIVLGAPRPCRVASHSSYAVHHGNGRCALLYGE